MTYEEAVEWLMYQLPMYQRVGAPAYRKSLDNIIILCDALGNPHQKFSSIHVAGTNGKGSVCHMLASVLKSTGLKTGLTTSPHLTDFKERIRINGAMIPETAVVEFVSLIQAVSKDLRPSFFEIGIAMAFWYFEKEKVDIAVVETGMGGRLDSTNLIQPLVSVITNIGLDHTEFLGETYAQIATEKAGIIKPNTPVVVGAYHEETWPVFETMAINKLASLVPAFTYYKAEFIDDEIVITLKNKPWIKARAALKGKYQLQNYATTAATLDVLKSLGIKISKQAIQKGLENVAQLSGFRGRWQIFSKNPLIILDTAHNPDGYLHVADQFNALTHKSKFVLLGFTKEKNPSDFVSLLRDNILIYMTPMTVPRSKSFEELKMWDSPTGKNIRIFPNVDEAVKSITKNLTKESALLVSGSSFMIGDFLNIMKPF